MNIAHAVAYAVDGLIMVALPVALAVVLARRFSARWNTWLIGMLAFIVSQVVHLPLLLGIDTLVKSSKAAGALSGAAALALNAVVLGLLAGLCEEIARWIFLRFVARHARAWRDGLMFGAGHGGIEAIILGAGVLSQLASMLALTPAVVAKLPAEQQATINQQVQAFWTAPLWQVSLGWVERIFALCMHLACTLLVLEAVRRRRVVWLFLAIAWHALVDGVTVAATPLGTLAVEGILAVLAVISVGMIVALRRLDTPDDRRISAEAPSRANPRGTLQPSVQPPFVPEEGYASPHLQGGGADSGPRPPAGS